MFLPGQIGARIPTTGAPEGSKDQLWTATVFLSTANLSQADASRLS